MRAGLAKLWNAVRVYLTGELCVEAGGTLIRSDAFPGRQGRVAFAYLVTDHDRAVSRDTLIDLVWPERAPRAHEVALSALMSKLRNLLTVAGLSRASLETTARGYRLNLPAGAWVDTDAAAEAVHAAEAALRSERHQAAYGPAVVANAILRRAFLPGDEGTWIEDRRAQLLRYRLRALDCLAEIHAWNHEPALALRAAEEAVELEPYRESSYRALMRIHDQAGNPAEALRVYERLERLLAQDLGTRPAPETTAVLRELQESRSR